MQPARLLVELVGGVTAPRPTRSLFNAGVQLPLEACLGGPGFLAATWLVVVSDLLWLALPATLLMVGGVLSALALANVSPIGVVGLWRAAGWRAAHWPLSGAFGLALVELAGLRLLRPGLFPTGGLT